MKNCYPQIRSSITAMVLAVVLLGLPTGADAAKLFKWIDDDGNIRYSDQIPPEQIKKGLEVLNAQGIVVERTEAAQSPEELAAARKAQQELEAKLAVEKKIKKIQDQQDRVLLLTFSSVQEMARVKDDRLDVLESVIQLIKKSIDATTEKLSSLETTAVNQYTSRGTEIPGGLMQNIEFFTRKKSMREKQLELKETEKRKINQQYEIDIARYRFLKEEQ